MVVEGEEVAIDGVLVKPVGRLAIVNHQEYINKIAK